MVIALRIWKKIPFFILFYGLRIGNWQLSDPFPVRPILLGIVTLVIVVLQALFYIASCCDLPWYTPALFLVSSNLLVYGLPLILTVHILRKYQHRLDAAYETERVALAERKRRRQRKAWGLMITVVVTLAAALASVALLVVAALLGGRFRQSLVLVSTDVSFTQTLLTQIVGDCSWVPQRGVLGSVASLEEADSSRDTSTRVNHPCVF